MAEPPPTPPRKRTSRVDTWVALALALLLVVSFAAILSTDNAASRRVHVTRSPFFVGQLDEGNVASVEVQGDRLGGRLRRSVRGADDILTGEPSRIDRFETAIPVFVDRVALERRLQAHDVPVDAKATENTGSGGSSLLVALLPALLVVGALVWLMRRAGGAGAGGFGRSRARRVEPSTQKITFADVAGVDESKGELAEIADFLRQPDKYRALGARRMRRTACCSPVQDHLRLLAAALLARESLDADEAIAAADLSTFGAPTR